MDTVSTISTAISLYDASTTAYENYGKIRKLWNKYISKTIRVLVLGESGSGKTQFFQSLNGSHKVVRNRTQSCIMAKIELPDGHQVEFYDVPGHQSLKTERQKHINGIPKGKYQGVINVVCYGYQSTSETDPNDVFSGDDVRHDFLKINREKEIKQLNEWLPLVNAGSNLSWVVTIINKADIWWEQHDEVMAYYRSSTYNELIEEISRVSTLELVPYCSIISPFCGVPMKIIIGEEEKHVMHNYLCGILTGLTEVKWRK